jgi:hypothetical protein
MLFQPRTFPSCPAPNWLESPERIASTRLIDRTEIDITPAQSRGSSRLFENLKIFSNFLKKSKIQTLKNSKKCKNLKTSKINNCKKID